MNQFESIVASELATECSSVDVRLRLKNHNVITAVDGSPIITEIAIVPTLTPSSYYIDEA